LHLDIFTAYQSAAVARSPDALWAGIGCKRGTSIELIRYAFDAVCRDYSLDRTAIAGIATLNSKEEETGLLAFCRAQDWPISFWSAAELKDCLGPHLSARTEAFVGTPSVAEAAALLAARQNGGVPQLVVPKQSFQWLRDSGAVTLAIAQSTNPAFSNLVVV
jgi:cobalamin biosynthesis protein CbiG